MTALGIADMHGKECRGWPQIILGALAAYLLSFAVRLPSQPLSGPMAPVFVALHNIIMVTHFFKAKESSGGVLLCSLIIWSPNTCSL